MASSTYQSGSKYLFFCRRPNDQVFLIHFSDPLWWQPVPRNSLYEPVFLPFLHSPRQLWINYDFRWRSDEYFFDQMIPSSRVVKWAQNPIVLFAKIANFHLGFFICRNQLEFGQNDQREDASHFRFGSSRILSGSFLPKYEKLWKSRIQFRLTNFSKKTSI